MYIGSSDMLTLGDLDIDAGFESKQASPCVHSGIGAKWAIQNHKVDYSNFCKLVYYTSNSRGNVRSYGVNLYSSVSLL